MVRPLFDEGTPLEVERQMASRLVTAFLATTAIEAGTASFRFSWAAPSQLVDAEGEVQDLSGLVDAALADEAALAALELWLRKHKVGMDVALGDDEGPEIKKGTPGQPAVSPSPHPEQAADQTKVHEPVRVPESVP